MEHALVLRAVGIECRVQRARGGFALTVAAEDAPQAEAEIESYARENQEARRAADAPVDTDGWVGVLCFGVVLFLVAVCNDRSVGGFDWFAAGKTHAGGICAGQWWRTVTALTLHADLAHLLANLVVGGLFGIFAARHLGAGLAWFGILLGGAGGNLVNACLRPAGHTSVGASTAIFAALGLLAAWTWTQRRMGAGISLRRWAPLIGGVVLLGMLGGGGSARTDVGAHITGFCCGVLCGAVCGRLRLHARIGDKGQAWLAAAALGLLAASWAIALVNAAAA